MVEAVKHHRFPSMPEVGNRRSMVHVEDVVRAAILAATHPHAIGQIFIISDGQAYSTRQMCNERLRRALGMSVPSWSVPVEVLRGLARVGDVIGKVRRRRFLFDSDALDKLIGSAWSALKRLKRS